MDIITVAIVVFFLVLGGGFLYAQYFRKKKFDAWAFVLVRREGGSEVVVSRANIMKIEGMKQPFLMLTDLKNDVAPLPTGMSMKYKNKPAYFFVRKSPETYTPLEKVAKLAIEIEKVGDKWVIAEKNPIKRAIMLWLSKRGVKLKKPEHIEVLEWTLKKIMEQKDVYEPILPPEHTPIIKEKDGKKVVTNIWSMITSPSFDERVAWLQSKRYLEGLYNKLEWIKKYLPHITIGIVVVLMIIVFWQLGQVAKETHDTAIAMKQVAESFRQLVSFVVSKTQTGPTPPF